MKKAKDQNHLKRFKHHNQLNFNSKNNPNERLVTKDLQKKKKKQTLVKIETIKIMRPVATKI